MLSVLQVYKNYAPLPGGIETHVRQLAEGMTRRGARSTVLVASPNHQTWVEELGGVRVIRASRLAELASTPISLQLIRQMRRVPADIVHLHVPYPIGELGYLLAGRGRPLVVTYHSDVVRQWWARPLYVPMVRAVLRQAGAIIASSPPYLRSSPILRAYADRCTVVPFGVELVRFRPTDLSVATIRARWSSPGYPRLILFVGRFRAYKGLAYLLRAMAGLPARLLLIGDGPAAPRLRVLANQLGLAEQVAFVGLVSDDDLPAYYAACDAFVLPSIQRSEAFGMTLLEAMASGRPVVSTELGTGTSWVNQDGVTGLVVPPADVGALARALEALLRDRPLAERLGRAGRERVEAVFGVETMLDRIEEIYRAVAGA